MKVALVALVTFAVARPDLPQFAGMRGRPEALWIDLNAFARPTSPGGPRTRRSRIALG